MSLETLVSDIEKVQAHSRHSNYTHLKIFNNIKLAKFSRHYKLVSIY